MQDLLMFGFEIDIDNVVPVDFDDLGYPPN